MATLIIEGGEVLRPDMSIDRADVAIDRETGTITAIGTDVGSSDETLDATGGLVMPGLVNAHTHVAMTLLRGYADDKPVDRWLEDDIWPAEAEFTPDDVEAGAALGILEMIRSGTTTFCDMYFEMDRIADAAIAGGVRARLGYGMVTAGKDDAEAAAELERGISIADGLDGVGNGRIHGAYMPHSLTTVDLERLADILPTARELGLPLHVHANESPAFVEPILDQQDERPLVHADHLGLLAAGDFVAHAVHVDDEEIALLADRDVGVVHCPASNMKLASGMAPVTELRSAGVSVGLGTDGAASNNDLDMFDELRDAAMLGKLAANDPRAVPAATAVRMATAEGADVLGLDVGRIAEGRPADLAVVDLGAPRLQPRHDLVSHLAYAVNGSDVRHTVCDGRILMRDRECLTLDETAVIERARSAAANLRDRIAA